MISDFLYFNKKMRVYIELTLVVYIYYIYITDYYVHVYVFWRFSVLLLCTYYCLIMHYSTNNIVAVAAVIEQE